MNSLPLSPVVISYAALQRKPLLTQHDLLFELTIIVNSQVPLNLRL